MRKLLSVLLVIAMVMVVLPAGVLAKSVPCVSINKTVLTEEACSTLYPDGSVEFDSNTSTLTLDNANIEGDGYVVEANIDLTVKLKGENDVTSNKGTFGSAFMITNNRSITFVGDGIIYSAGDISAVTADNVIAAESVFLKFSDGNYGISGSVTVNDKAFVNACGSVYGVSNGSMTVNNGTLIAHGDMGAAGFQDADSTYSFTEGAIVKGGSSEDDAVVLTGSYDLKQSGYKYLYVNFVSREIVYDNDGLSEATYIVDGSNLVINAVPKNNYTAEKAVYIDPALNVVKAVDKSADNENKFVIPDIGAANIAIMTKSENVDTDPIILQQTDDATTSVVMLEDKVIATQIINDEIQDNLATLFGSTYYADDGEKIDFNAGIITDQSKPCKVFAWTYLSDSDYHFEVPASKTADRLRAMKDSLLKSINEFHFSMYSDIKVDIAIAINSSNPNIEISSSLFNRLTKQEKTNISISAKTDNADVYLNSVAVKELGELSEGKTAVNITTTASDPAANAELCALSPNSTVWDAKYVKVVDENGNPYVFDENSDAKFNITLTDTNVTITRGFGDTVIAAKGSTKDGETKLVKNKNKKPEEINLPNPFYFKDGAWCVDEPDGHFFNNEAQYYIKDSKIVVGAVEDDIRSYYSDMPDDSYGKLCAFIFSNNIGDYYIIRDDENSCLEYNIDGKTYIEDGSDSIGLTHLTEKPVNALKICSVSDTTTSPVGLISESWIDYADTSWYNDTDTSFIINTPEALAGVAKLSKEGITFSNKSIRLTSHIDLSSHIWTPIKNFSGSFNGGGAVISNMCSIGKKAALFIEATDAEIYNFAITGEVRGKSVAAGVVCTAANTQLYNIDNSCNVWTNDNAGGICAGGNNISVKNCVNNGTITAEQTTPPNSSLCAGGIAGRLSGASEVENLVNYGDVSGGTCGAILGEDTVNSIVKNCYYTKSSKLIGYGSSTPADCEYYDLTSAAFSTGVSISSPSGSDNSFNSLNKNVTNSWVNSVDAIKYCQWKEGDAGLPALDLKLTAYESWTEAGEEAVAGTDYVLGDGFCVIKTEKGLAQMAKEVNDGTYGRKTTYLENDLNLSGIPWTPIGNERVGFTGIFDGLGHVIKGAVVSAPETSYIGLFGYIGDESEICNLGVVGGTMKGNNAVGGIAGACNGKITNCFSSVAVIGNQAGAIVGVATEPVTNCYAYGRVSGLYIGGIVGDCRTTLSHSYAQTGKVSGALSDICIESGGVNSAGNISSISVTSGNNENFKTVGCGAFDETGKMITLAENYTIDGSLQTKTTTYAYDGDNLTDALNAWVSSNSADYTYNAWVNDAGGYPAFTASYEVLLDNDKCTLIPEIGSASPVAGGGSFSFKLDIASGYKKGTNFAVKTNGKTVTENNGVYTIDNICSNQLITVEGISRVTRKTGGSSGSSGYTVIYNTNDGSKITNAMVASNTAVSEPVAPTKEGYVFDGWYTDKELTVKYDFNTKITKTFTLYAKWTEDLSNKIILKIGEKETVVFGKTIENDAAPIIKSDRTMLLARFVAENLGATLAWDEKEKNVTITKNNITIIITIGSDKATVNGEEVTLDSPAFIENDRTYTPLRFVVENLGASVALDEQTQKVTITKK